MRKNSRLRRFLVCSFLALCAVFAALGVSAQQPAFKGIWEPVNYKEDLNLTDVFFVNPEVGWVSGDAGTILHTKDSGDTWTVQLGGDPRSQESSIIGLQFVDETHGWARARSGKLLRTLDGENWEQIGTLDGAYGVFSFTSTTNGVYVNSDKIRHTSDAGRTWKDVFTCRTKLEVNGLIREDSCRLNSVHFPSAMVGYAVSRDHPVPGVFAVAKTEDGGMTWKTSVVREVGSAEEVFFIDESIGFVRLWGSKLYKTGDGGMSWSGVVATPGPKIRFTDPDVGWSMSYSTLSYTTDGGRRWSSRLIAFPIPPNDFSLPRRDRAYVVGDHGMVFRYRVVPATETVAKAIDGPAMPMVDATLELRAEQIEKQVEGLQAEIAQAMQKQNTATNPEINVVEVCCSVEIKQLETSVEAFAAEVPVVTARYRNLNMVLVGLRLVGQLFGEAQGLKDSVRGLRKARDFQSASSMLTELSKYVGTVEASAKTALQKPK